MLAFLERADDDGREDMQQMLNDITDLSTDEEAPAMNTGGRRGALANGATGSTAAFLCGMTATQLQGCDSGSNGGQDFPSFATCVLTIWTLVLGCYTWFWLRSLAICASICPCGSFFNSSRRRSERRTRTSFEWPFPLCSEEDHWKA